ncbi:hypothetical protein KP509_02G041700 [Ceratopteris richardii]|nr:hypothetical protein KP509_02G041700 [Ceratopteris richardii]
MDMDPPSEGAPAFQPPNQSSSPTMTPLESASMLPADAASKRQRRPNVRLNEIGSESSLANVVEYILKRKGRTGDVGGRKGRSLSEEKLDRPGKFRKKSKPLPLFDINDKVGDYAGSDHAEDTKPLAPKPYATENLTPKAKDRKGAGLGKKLSVGNSMSRHVNRPRVLSTRVEGKGNNWMQKAADEFLEAADDCAYGCSITDKRLNSPTPHAQPPIFSRESDSPKRLKKIQSGVKRTKRLDAGPSSSPNMECAPKEGLIDDKEEPSSSALQEQRMQGPIWERGVPPLDERVREWMQKIGLEKYAPVFQHHEVGDDVVPLLTMDDLREMGIAAVGARRKFFTEITKRRQSLMLSDPVAEES